MKRKAFTLVELLAVIVLIGVIITIAVPSANRIVDYSRKKKCAADKDAIENLIRTDITNKLSLNESVPYTNNYYRIQTYIETYKIGDLNKFAKYNGKEIKIEPKDNKGITEYTFEFKDFCD